MGNMGFVPLVGVKTTAATTTTTATTKTATMATTATATATAETSGSSRRQNHVAAAQHVTHESVLKKATRVCARRFGINHVTLQITAVAARRGSSTHQPQPHTWSIVPFIGSFIWSIGPFIDWSTTTHPTVEAAAIPRHCFKGTSHDQCLDRAEHRVCIYLSVVASS